MSSVADGTEGHYFDDDPAGTIISRRTSAWDMEESPPEFNSSRNPFVLAAGFLDSKPGVILTTTMVILSIVNVFVSLVYEALFCDADSELSTILSYISIVLACFFMLELIIKLFGFGIDYYRYSIIHTLDAFIVVVSFSLQVAFLSDSSLSTIFSVVIFCRLWMLFKLIKSANRFIEAGLHKKILELEDEVKRLKLENSKTSKLP
eukprot:TRINITY_DN9598_c0_g1_i1.p1 TRINITY_DN9598_c0_g1~~TRINITY_DN9598_c0_g1_i1.p1  ORF type:complete len:214 (-),score=67.28 TRINITY_DN9598_c0_g1_i1:411-1025(-)